MFQDGSSVCEYSSHGIPEEIFGGTPGWFLGWDSCSHESPLDFLDNFLRRFPKQSVLVEFPV